MQKTSYNVGRDIIARDGKIWVHMPELNYRQSSGVEYKGVYMTPAEYREWKQKKELRNSMRR